MTSTNVQNIKAIHRLATATETAEGKAWYPTAQAIARNLASRYGIHEAEAAGVIAALSPRNRWERNVHDAEALISAYVAAGAEQAMLTKVCTFTNNKKKAVRILAAGVLTDADVLEILSGPKLREFYSCIRGITDVCIDGHAFCIWNGGRTGLADVPAIGVKLRREIKADYAQAAEDLGLTAAALQAITWVAWRRLHSVKK